MSDNVLIRVNNITKYYDIPEGRCEVFEDFSLDVYRNEFVCVLGHSGCGKSTLLRIIAGFEKVHNGQIIIDSVEHIKPSKDVIMLFQSFEQLLPWKTIEKGIAYPLLATKNAKTKKEAMIYAEDIIKEVSLYDFRKCFPHQLSGGMKQRAAVARALALKPKVLLMDEPFASLDEMNRSELQKLTLHMCKKYNMTVVFVTHSIDEALKMADRIVVMENNGRIKNIFSNPNKQDKNRSSDKELLLKLMDIMMC